MLREKLKNYNIILASGSPRRQAFFKELELDFTIQVKEIEENQTIIIELRVAPGDMGKVIGKQGRIAKAIRTVVKAAAMKENKKVVVEIVQ